MRVIWRFAGQKEKQRQWHEWATIICISNRLRVVTLLLCIHTSGHIIFNFVFNISEKRRMQGWGEGKQHSTNKECKCEYYTFIPLPASSSSSSPRYLAFHKTTKENLRQGLNGRNNNKNLLKNKFQFIFGVNIKRKMWKNISISHPLYLQSFVTMA